MTEPIRRVFQVVADDGAVVPTLWQLEIANSLIVAIRRGRIDANFRRAVLADLALLDITTDNRTDVHAWGETLNLADRFQLTLYDAAYLELAQRRALPLATLDSEMAMGRRLLVFMAMGRRLLVFPYSEQIDPDSPINRCSEELAHPSKRPSKQRGWRPERSEGNRTAPGPG